MSEPEPLGSELRSLFEHLDHAGDPAGTGSGVRQVSGEAGQEALGTRVRFMLSVADGRLQAVRFRAYGCPFTLAACEWLARGLEGRTQQDARAIGGPLDWVQRLGIPEARLGRLIVIEDALRRALTRL